MSKIHLNAHKNISSSKSDQIEQILDIGPYSQCLWIWWCWIVVGESDDVLLDKVECESNDGEHLFTSVFEIMGKF